MLHRRWIIALFLIVLTCLPCYAADVELGWDPNTESNLAGYKIYYGTASGDPYDGEDIFEGDSPIKLHIDPDGDPNYYVDNDPIDKRCKFVLTGLDLVNYDYYLVLTAYNDIDESGHSNEVNTFDVGGDPPPGGGGGSSGGCFIGSTEKVEKLLIEITAILFFMFVVAMAIIGLNFIVSVVSLFDSDVKVITLTSSIMLFLIIAIFDLSYRGIPIELMAVVALFFLGVCNILIMAGKVIGRRFVKC